MDALGAVQVLALGAEKKLTVKLSSGSKWSVGFTLSLNITPQLTNLTTNFNIGGKVKFPGASPPTFEAVGRCFTK